MKPEEITARENPRLKRARQVRDGKLRDEIFVEGLRLAEEAFRANLEIIEVFVIEKFLQTERGAKITENLTENRVKIALLSEKLLASIADTETPNGIILIAEKPLNGEKILAENLARNFAEKQIPLILVLHKLNNPSNIGAILRTAEAVGASGIILTKNSANPFSPKSLRSSTGAAFRLPMWTNVDFSEAISFCRRNNLQTVCADIRAEKSYFEINWSEPKALFLGAEAEGLNAEEITEIDEGLRIPMKETVESLNVAVAAGVVLYEILRQRRY